MELIHIDDLLSGKPFFVYPFEVEADPDPHDLVEKVVNFKEYRDDLANIDQFAFVVAGGKMSWLLQLGEEVRFTEVEGDARRWPGAIKYAFMAN